MKKSLELKVGKKNQELVEILEKILAEPITSDDTFLKLNDLGEQLRDLMMYHISSRNDSIYRVCPVCKRRYLLLNYTEATKHHCIRDISLAKRKVPEFKFPVYKN